MNNDKTQITYGVYVRKSSESEDRQVQSIERQTDDLMDIVNKERLSMDGSAIQEAKSAFTPGREGFGNLVSLTHKGTINAWFCWHANRLSRNPIDSGTVIHLMDLGLLKHIRTPSRVYHNTPTDKMMLQIEFTMSKKDSDDKSVFVKSGLKKRYKRGFPNGKARIGFINDKYQEQGNRGLLVDDERLEKVKMVFRRFLKGCDSIRTITDFANEELQLRARPSKVGGLKPIAKSLMHSILCDPIYAGFFYGLDEDGKNHTRYELESTLPRIISEDEHYRVLNILSKRNIKKIHKHERTYMDIIRGADGNYMGIEAKFQLICDCKKKFSYINRKTCLACNVPISSMKSPKYLEYTYYYNVKRRKDRNLKAKTVSEKKINDFVLNYIRENISLSFEFVQWAKMYVPTLKNMEVLEKQQLVASRQKKIVGIAEEKRKLRGLYRRGLITESELIEDLKELDIDVSNKTKVVEVDDWIEKLDSILDYTAEIEKILEKGSVKEKRVLLKQIGLNLVWDEENLSITNTKWTEILNKRRKSVLSKYQQFEHGIHVGNKGAETLFKAYRPVMWAWLDSVRTQYYRDYYSELYGHDDFDILFL